MPHALTNRIHVVDLGAFDFPARPQPNEVGASGGSPPAAV